MTPKTVIKKMLVDVRSTAGHWFRLYSTNRHAYVLVRRIRCKGGPEVHRFGYLEPKRRMLKVLQ